MGSLFKLRDYWYTSYSNEEFSHANALSVGNVDNDADGGDKIVIGSFSGMLRILRPVKKGPSQPEDTLVETNLGEPILQVACRPLEPVGGGPARNLLAILFPKRLVLARVLREGENGKNDALNVSYRLMIYQEAHLEHTPYNFVCGAFGHASHELVCVQSMDGQLTIADHNKILLQCFLPSSQFLVPGCLAYCAVRDCFLTNNSAMNLMCYSFTSLLSANHEQETQSHVEGENEVPKLRHDAISPAWTFCLGEDAVAIEVCRLTRGLVEGDVDVVVVCSVTLFVLQLSGEPRYVRRLDVAALCATSYLLPCASTSNLLIGTVHGSVQVYSDMSLEWSAKMTSGASLSLAVVDMCRTRGLIASLNTEGAIALNYLGTDPADEPIQPLESAGATDAEMERALRRVQQAIKQATSGATGLGVDTGAHAVASPTAESKGAWLHLRVDAPSAVGGGAGTATLTLRSEGAGEVERLTILAEAVAPVTVEPPVRKVARVAPGEVVQIPLHIEVKPDKDGIIPSSLDVRVVVTYHGGTGAMGTAQVMTRVPFSSVAYPAPPHRGPSFVVQLNTNLESPPSLLDLFGDMTSAGTEVTANVMSVQYVNGAGATILVSKNAARFRVQASTMEGLWLLTAELHERLRFQYGENVQFEVPDGLPVEDYFRVIDTHLAVRREMLTAQNALSCAAETFRAVQKRLLIVFRERNPAPLGAMESLFEESYAKLQECTNAVCAAATRQRQAAAMLSCCSRLLVMLLCIKCQNTLKEEEEIRLLESLFSCPISAESEYGWEEATTMALDELLKVPGRATRSTPTALFSSGLAGGNVGVAASSSVPNGERLKRLIKALFDRLQSGSPLTES